MVTTIRCARHLWREPGARTSCRTKGAAATVRRATNTLTVWCAAAAQRPPNQSEPRQSPHLVFRVHHRARDEGEPARR